MSTPRRAVSAIDFHTAGEPFRIVDRDVVALHGTTVAEKRIYAQGADDVELVRTMLCREPRGHADMYGCFVVDPDDAGADFGVLFWHNDGYSTACGHGTIALGVWALQSGRVSGPSDGVTVVTIDVPSGRVSAHVQRVAGVVVGVTFENVASYPVARSIAVETSRGRVHVDVAFAGALYASVAAADLGLEVTEHHALALRAIGREIKWALNETDVARHPFDSRLSGIYGTILFDELDDTSEGLHQRNVTVFADGRLDRSPCGSGTAARLALLAADGRLDRDRDLLHDSIIETRFVGRYRPATHCDVPGAIVATVEGMAHETSRATFTLDPRDSLGSGFILA